MGSAAATLQMVDASVLRKCVGVLLALALATGAARAAEYQFEDNVRDLMASARELTGKDELEEAALEYENVLAIDPLHREAALPLFELYLKVGDTAAAEELLAKLPRMGVDTTEQGALRGKLDGAKAHPPAKRKRALAATAPLDASQIPGLPKPGAPPAAKAPAGKAGDLDDDLLDAGPPAKAAAPAPAPSGAPAPAPSAKPGKDDLDDVGL